MVQNKFLFCSYAGKITISLSRIEHCLYGQADVLVSYYTRSEEQRNAHRHLPPRDRSRCEAHKLFFDTPKLEKRYKTRKLAETSHTNHAAIEVGRNSSSTPLHRRLVYTRVVCHRPKLCRERSTKYTFHWSLHPRNISGRTQSRAVALATSRNFVAQSTKG